MRGMRRWWLGGLRIEILITGRRSGRADEARGLIDLVEKDLATLITLDLCLILLSISETSKKPGPSEEGY
jgi:hypothetical protein